MMKLPEKLRRLSSLDEKPSQNREFWAGFLGATLILLVILGLPAIALLLSQKHILVFQPYFYVLPIIFTLGSFQLLYRLIIKRQNLALLGVGAALLLIALLVLGLLSFTHFMQTLR